MPRTINDAVHCALLRKGEPLIEPAFTRHALTKTRAPFRVALVVPTSGTCGLWGASCIACAELGVEAWNDRGGVFGREVVLHVIDGSDENTQIEAQMSELAECIDAVVGMHSSAVRERIIPTLGNELPLVFTPTYEGGLLSERVYAIGETPELQLLPPLIWLTERFRMRRWHLVGHDYRWPWLSHRAAMRALERRGCTITGSHFVPFGHSDFGAIIEQVRETGTQAVLLSLVGQDAIAFNRAFCAAGLVGKVLRLSCAIEENSLLGIGADATEGLFVAASYFGSLDNRLNGAFRERYWSRFGERAPVLNSFGQSVFEGIEFLRALVAGHRRSDQSLQYSSVRDTRWVDNARKRMSVYLAEAQGLRFSITHQFD